MFRAAQANPFDDAIVKATDENLTSENWELILNVCDKVGAQDTGGKDAVASMIKRLAHRNANVQLYTLELANALSQNCGIKMHKELASRSFTDALLRLANDRNTHQQVKAKILERMAEWAEMFSKDPDLGIMEQAYTRLKSQNPSLHPPSKPFKQQITDVDRQKEEDELQMALALSIKDKTPQDPARKDSGSPSAGASSSQNQTSTQPPPTGTTAATVSRVRGLFDFQPSEPGELQFRKGDIIAVLESVYRDWWKGSLRGQTGIFPLNYVEKLQDPTPDEMQREAHMEAEVFAEIKNVEKLLTLLSTSSSDMNVRDNEEVTTLYHSTLAIRPKLIELIGKYSQKKDDFTQLNEKFIKARRDYELLLEASMTHTQQPQYRRPPQELHGFGRRPQGYPPQPPDPQRFYGSAPQGSQEPSYPPQDGPAPFYMIPPSQQQYIPSQTTGDRDDRRPKPMSPGLSYGQQQQQPDRRSTSSHSNVQELSSGAYDDSRPTYDLQQQPSYPPQQITQHTGPQYPPQQTAQHTGPQYPPQQTPQHTGPQFPPQQTPQHTGQQYPPQQNPQYTGPQYPPQETPQHTGQQYQNNLPYENPAYSPSEDGPYPQQPPYALVPQPLQPSHPPPNAPGSQLPGPSYPPSASEPPPQQQGAYQAYQPPGAMRHPADGVGVGGGKAEGDASDFYR